MAVSGVSLSVLRVGARQALVPIAADFLTQLFLAHIGKQVKNIRQFYTRQVIVMIPAAGAVYWKYGVPALNPTTIFMGFLYLAYKAALIFLILLGKDSKKAK